jgi:hypothetical protein
MKSNISIIISVMGEFINQNYNTFSFISETNKNPTNCSSRQDGRVFVAFGVLAFWGFVGRLAPANFHHNATSICNLLEVLVSALLVLVSALLVLVSALLVLVSTLLVSDLLLDLVPVYYIGIHIFHSVYPSRQLPIHKDGLVLGMAAYNCPQPLLHHLEPQLGKKLFQEEE